MILGACNDMQYLPLLQQLKKDKTRHSLIACDNAIQAKFAELDKKMHDFSSVFHGATPAGGSTSAHNPPAAPVSASKSMPAPASAANQASKGGQVPRIVQTPATVPASATSSVWQNNRPVVTTSATKTINLPKVLLNAKGHRIDPASRIFTNIEWSVYHNKKRDKSPCSSHHIIGICTDKFCPYSHEPLEEDMTDVLTALSRGVPCKMSVNCRNHHCVQGHHCSKSGCIPAKCKFPARMHDIDSWVVKEIGSDPITIPLNPIPTAPAADRAALAAAPVAPFDFDSDSAMSSTSGAARRRLARARRVADRTAKTMASVPPSRVQQIRAGATSPLSNDDELSAWPAMNTSSEDVESWKAFPTASDSSSMTRSDDTGTLSDLDTATPPGPPETFDLIDLDYEERNESTAAASHMDALKHAAMVRANQLSQPHLSPVTVAAAQGHFSWADDDDDDLTSGPFALPAELLMKKPEPTSDPWSLREDDDDNDFDVAEDDAAVFAAQRSAWFEQRALEKEDQTARVEEGQEDAGETDSGKQGIVGAPE
jgi:hypothetical protein